MRRNTSLFLSSIALVAAAACSDVPVAPKAADPASASLNRSGDPLSSSFVILPQGNVVNVVIPALGNSPVFTLSFPANAVCSDGGYGNWNAPCTPASGATRVTASYVNVSGRAGINFSPELRFVPSQVVTLSTMRNRDAVFAMERLPKRHQNWGVFAILFTPDATTLSNDALTDTSLYTHIDLSTGLVWRRIKHFSGYVWGTGNCDPTVDPTCTDTGTTVIAQ